jgi:hypothetical protein
LALATIIGTLFGTPTKTLIGAGILDMQDLLDSTTLGTGLITTISCSEIIGVGTMGLSLHVISDSDGYLHQTLDTTEKETTEELPTQIKTRLTQTATEEATTALQLLEEEPHRTRQVLTTTRERQMTKTQLTEEVVLRQITTLPTDKKEAKIQKHIVLLPIRITNHPATLLLAEALPTVA